MHRISVLKGERRYKDGIGTPIPESSEMAKLEQEEELDNDYWNIPEDIEDTYMPQQSDNRFSDAKQGWSRAAGLSFPRGKVPKDLPVNVRTRNLDVGLRIGRKTQHMGGAGTQGLVHDKAANAMEEQMRRIENRQAADAQLAAARNALEQTVWERGLASIPYLPGRWTEQVHEKVMSRLREFKEALDSAERLYASAEAKDKVPEVNGLRELLAEAQLHADNTKKAWVVLADAEVRLQEAARKGWPHGREEFESAERLVGDARNYLLEIGEAGTDADGRVRILEKVLNKRLLRVLKVRKDCERRRKPVQVLLDRLRHSSWETRYKAILDMAQMARQPVPCKVTFLGDLVSLADEKDWHENTGRGDTQVVQGVLTMMDDPEADVRRVVVEALPCVCPAGDPLVLKGISKLTRDPVNKVKIYAMDALAHLAARGDTMVVGSLCAMLEDPDTAVRALGVRLLPHVTLLPEDPHAIDEVLRRLSHVRRAEEHPHWATEERDVRLAALQALQLIAPLGHDKTTRMVVGVLRQSWERLLRDFTGCARDALRPHRGSITDYGESRGPINLRTQLQAIAKEGAMNCPAKCCEAASEVRMAAIQVLVAIAIKRSDLAEQREELAKSMTDPRALLKSGTSTPSTSATNTPFSFSRASSRPASGGRGGGDLKLRRAQMKAEQDKAYGDLVRYTTVVESLCERLGDMDREVRWSAAQALVQQVAMIDDVIMIEALAKCLSHSESEVQALATELIKGSALGTIVTRGNEDMTRAICVQFAAARRETRAAASRALIVHCEPGDPVVVSFLVPYLWNADSHVRQSALETLKILVPKGSVEVLEEVERGAFQPDPTLRIMAIYALSELARNDDNVTGALLEDLLFDQDDAVVCAATYAVARKAPRGAADTMDLLLNNTRDMNEAVRRASIEAITAISHKGDAAVVDAALTLIDDPDPSVRKQALETLSKVSDYGNAKVCSKIIARLGAQGTDGLRTLADLKDLRWSSARSLVFTSGSIGPPGTTHSASFDWSQPAGGLMMTEQGFRMPRGIPITDAATIRSKTISGSPTRAALRSSTSRSPARSAGLSVTPAPRASTGRGDTGEWQAERMGTAMGTGTAMASVTWGPTQTQRFVTAGTGSGRKAEEDGLPDAPLPHKPPIAGVLSLPFAVRPPTAPSLGPPLVFRFSSELHAVSRPGSRASTRLQSSQGRTMSGLACGGGAGGRLYSRLLLVDSDGGYDSLFGLILLALDGQIPQLVTTVHGTGEAVSAAVNVKRLFTTLLHPKVAVVPAVDVALHRDGKGRLCLSRPGSSLVRLDGSTRRVPSRFGPDYRRHLAQLADHLFLAPLGISHEPLLQPPGVNLRIANLERDLRLLSAVAGADVSDLEVQLEGLAALLDALTERGRDYYAELGRGLSRDGSRIVTVRDDRGFTGAATGATGATGRLSLGESAGTWRIHTRHHTRTTAASPRTKPNTQALTASRPSAGGPDVLRPMSKGGILRPPSRAVGSGGGGGAGKGERGGEGTGRGRTRSPGSRGGARFDRSQVTTPDVDRSNVQVFFVNEEDVKGGSRETREGEEGGAIEEGEEEGVGEREAWEITPPNSGGYDLSDWERALQAHELRERGETAGSRKQSAREALGALTGGVSNKPPSSCASGRTAGGSPRLRSRGSVRSTLSSGSAGGGGGEVTNRAVAALLEELEQAQDSSYTMLCLGSLTMLAAALDADEELVHRKMKNVVVMGGAVRVSPSAWHDHACYTQGGAEFNFYFDAAATYRVIHSGLAITIIGLEVANADVCTSDQRAALIAAQLEADQDKLSTPAWLLRALMLAFDMSVSYAAVACFHLARPDCFRLEEVWVRVDAHSGKISETNPGAQLSVPVMLATDMRRDFYVQHLRCLLTDGHGLDSDADTAAEGPVGFSGTSEPRTAMPPYTGASSRKGVLKPKSVLTWAGREPVGRDRVPTSGSKILRLESVATSVGGRAA